MNLLQEPKSRSESSGPQRCTHCGIFLAAAYPSPDERGTPTFFLARGTVGTSSKGNSLEHKDPGRYIPIIFALYSWGSLFGFPLKSL